eukprot:8878919-Heterocapsa_arctica.AAC.1
MDSQGACSQETLQLAILTGSATLGGSHGVVPLGLPDPAPGLHFSSWLLSFLPPFPFPSRPHLVVSLGAFSDGGAVDVSDPSYRDPSFHRPGGYGVPSSLRTGGPSPGKPRVLSKREP